MRTVRYAPGGDNAVLRLALYEMWNSRCYWCTEPVDLANVQIDHVIPKSIARQRLVDLIASGDLPTDFDLDAPHNLAPICGRCNREKSGRDLVVSRRLGDVLELAAKRAPAVVRRFARFRAATDLETHLLGVVYADLQPATSRDQLREHGEIIVQRIALIDESLADYWTVYNVEHLTQRNQETYGVPLNTRGRAAVTAVEAILETSLDEAFAAGVDELIAEALTRIQDALEGREVDLGHPTVGEPTLEHCDLLFDSLDFARDGALVSVTAPVTFYISASASIVQDSPDGDGLLELQGDGTVEGKGSIVMTWPVDSSGEPGEGTVDIFSIDCDVWTSG